MFFDNYFLYSINRTMKESIVVMIERVLVLAESFLRTSDSEDVGPIVFASINVVVFDKQYSRDIQSANSITINGSSSSSFFTLFGLGMILRICSIGEFSTRFRASVIIDMSIWKSELLMPFDRLNTRRLSREIWRWNYSCALHPWCIELIEMGKQSLVGKIWSCSLKKSLLRRFLLISRRITEIKQTEQNTRDQWYWRELLLTANTNGMKRPLRLVDSTR